MRWRAKTKNVVLPCGHEQKRISNLESNNVRVRSGDVGVCMACGEWWECIGLSSERIRYIPDEQDKARMRAALDKARSIIQ